MGLRALACPPIGLFVHDVLLTCLRLRTICLALHLGGDMRRRLTIAQTKTIMTVADEEEDKLPPTPVAAVWLHPSTPADSFEMTYVGAVAE